MAFKTKQYWIEHPEERAEREFNQLMGRLNSYVSKMECWIRTSKNDRQLCRDAKAAIKDIVDKGPPGGKTWGELLKLWKLDHRLAWAQSRELWPTMAKGWVN